MGIQAEYNLGVMYFKGQGVPVDRARGAVWMVLAAERGQPEYVKARDLMATVLSKPEFARTDDLWGALKKNGRGPSRTSPRQGAVGLRGYASDRHTRWRHDG